MNSEELYQTLVEEFREKVGRDLKEEELEFIKWMVEQHELEKQ
ncbi:hypothetical protein [Halobacillus sp. A1]|nr:hypothetical protein [Halobacillus sp. A1]